MSLADLRQEYAHASLTERDVDADPMRQFAKWFAQAQQAGLLEPNAMTLATVSAHGAPSARMVLLKAGDARGFVFFTDYRSKKGAELDANPRAALCFWWDGLQRQVRVEGVVARVSASESAEYFRTRPHGSKLGAWASHQSSVLPSREVLEAEVGRIAAQYPDGAEVPLPPHWGGYRLVPDAVEFWQGRESRLHDRIAYRRDGVAWTRKRLSP